MLYENGRRFSQTDEDLSSTFKQLQSAYRDAIGTSTLRPEVLDNKLTTGQVSLKRSTRSSSPQKSQDRPKSNSSWFTRPVHRTLQPDLSSSTSDGHPRAVPINASMEQLAFQYFPTTLRTIHAMSNLEQSGKETLSRSRQHKASTLPGTSFQRPKSAMVTDRFSSSQTFGHTSADILQTRSVGITSPFEHDLARLRLERLKIEEERLLELKRLEELERIRGPLPKWYELKTPRFHYEAKKHNKLMQNSDQWQELLDYRKELSNSKPFYV